MHEELNKVQVLCIDTLSTLFPLVIFPTIVGNVFFPNHSLLKLAKTKDTTHSIQQIDFAVIRQADQQAVLSTEL